MEQDAKRLESLRNKFVELHFVAQAVTNFGLEEYSKLFSSTGAVHVALIDELLNPSSPASALPPPAHLDQVMKHLIIILAAVKK